MTWNRVVLVEINSKYLLQEELIGLDGALHVEKYTTQERGFDSRARPVPMVEHRCSESLGEIHKRGTREIFFSRKVKPKAFSFICLL